MEDKIIFEWVKTHNLKDIDITLPKNKIIAVTWVSGSWKSSFAFDTVYKEGQYRYIESLGSYLRQFFSLGSRPDIDYSSWLSPAIAIEQNKRVWNSRSTVWTLTEIDDYLRLMFAKLGQIYCYNCWERIKPKSSDQIIDSIQENFLNQKVYILEDINTFKDQEAFDKFFKKNQKKVDSGWGFVRLLTNLSNFDSSVWEVNSKNGFIEYFYLEKPSIPEKFFPISVYGIFDRVVIEQSTINRLREDIVKILADSKKFGVYLDWQEWKENIFWYTDKNYCPNCNIEYPEFSTQHFSPNRQEWACEGCLGLGQTLQVDFGSIIDPSSKYIESVLPWRDSAYWQSILTQLSKKYWIKDSTTWWELPVWFQDIVIKWDGEALRLQSGEKYVNVKYNWIQEILTQQYQKWLLTVDFQAMLGMKDCEVCGWAKLKKESLNVFLEISSKKNNLEAVQNFEVSKNIFGDFKDQKKSIFLTQNITSSLQNQDIISFSNWKEKIFFHLQQIENLDFDSLDDKENIFWEKISWESIKKITKKKKDEILDLSDIKKWNFFALHLQILNPAEDEDWAQEKILKLNISDFQKLSIKNLADKITHFKTSTSQPIQLVERITTPLYDRASTIENLWLGYITINRWIDSISGWEIQRLRLAKQLWNKLTGIMYVLDEPTIGLDEKEIEKVIEAIKNLRDIWNTIIVVEHNEEFINAADWVVEIGPWAWDFWWNLVFSGPYEDFLKTRTLTSDYITWKKKIEVSFDHKPARNVVQIKKAHKHNLQNIDVNIHLWSFTIITWGSGAWKTTLMYHTLFRFLEEKQKFIQSYIRLSLLKKWYSWSDIISSPVMKREEYEHYQNLATQEFFNDLWVESIKWVERIDNVLYVDQQWIWKTPRSCPATFIGVFDNIRKIFAGTEAARMYGFSAANFSYNSKWACPECDWYGYKKVELQFLPDTYVPCSLCKGSRYKSEIMQIKWNWKTISDVLNMYIDDALELFQDIPFIETELKLLQEIGLGYLRLGQPAHTLSGWESQRLKLVKHLLKNYKGHTVYFLDEPTVWLHFQDIEKLLLVLRKFLDRWDTILMIEHEKNLLEFADSVIRLDEWKITYQKEK